MVKLLAVIGISCICGWFARDVAASAFDRSNLRHLDSDSLAVSELDKTFFALGLSMARSGMNFSPSEREVALVVAGLKDGLITHRSDIEWRNYALTLSTLAKERMALTRSKEDVKGKAFTRVWATTPGVESLPNGLLRLIKRIGYGKTPKRTDSVKLSLSGYLLDGSTIRAPQNFGAPAVSPIERLMPCFAQAITLMREGERSRLLCPPNLTYNGLDGPYGTPPGAYLLFDLDLIEVLP